MIFNFGEVHDALQTATEELRAAEKLLANVSGAGRPYPNEIPRHFVVCSASIVSIIRFADSRCANQFLIGGKVSPRLKALVLYAAEYSMDIFGVPVVVTHVLRTDSEQDEIYSKDLEYKKKPWKSTHQVGRGTDIRIHQYSVVQRVELVEHLNNHFPYTGTEGKLTAVLEKDHIHLQVGEG